MAEDSNSTVNQAFFDNRDRFEEWLKAEGYYPKRMDGEDTVWLLRGANEQRHIVFVGQKPGRSDIVEMGSTIGLPDHQTHKLRELTDDDMRELLVDLSLSLMYLGLENHWSGLPLEQIYLGERLYLPTVSRGDFIKALRSLRHGVRAASILIAKAIKEPMPDGEANGGLVN